MIWADVMGWPQACSIIALVAAWAFVMWLLSRD